MIAQHLGHLSPVELAVTLGVAIVPFLVLLVLVAVIRSRDVADEERADEARRAPC